jgi:hypothetical protein
MNDMIHNQEIYKTVKLNDGENVRILEGKNNLHTKGKNKFSNETYKISDKTGYKIAVTNDDNNKLHRKFKPAELLKVNKADNPISKAYIDEVKADKKAGKVVNALIKNAKMSKTEALQAVAAAM